MISPEVAEGRCANLEVDPSLGFFRYIWADMGWQLEIFAGQPYDTES